MGTQMTHDQIEEIWISVSNYLPERVKLDCAVDYIKTLLDVGIDSRILKAAGEQDDRLAQAINIVLDNDEDVDEDEEIYYNE